VKESLLSVTEHTMGKVRSRLKHMAQPLELKSHASEADMVSKQLRHNNFLILLGIRKNCLNS
jgi:hypothetical protein